VKSELLTHAKNRDKSKSELKNIAEFEQVCGMKSESENGIKTLKSESLSKKKIDFKIERNE